LNVHFFASLFAERSKDPEDLEELLPKYLGGQFIELERERFSPKCGIETERPNTSRNRVKSSLELRGRLAFVG